MALPDRWTTASEADLQADLDRMTEQLTRLERQARVQRVWIERLRKVMADRFPHRVLHDPPANWLRLMRSKAPPR